MKKEDGIYAMRFASQQMLIDKLKQENKQLKEKLLVTQTNEETFRLEMEDITRALGLAEDTLFDDVKAYARSLKDNWNELKAINKEYERLNKENGRGFKITSVQEYNIDELLSYKENWNKLKKDLELVVDYGLGDESSKWDKIYGEYAKSTLKFMQELQGSDSND